MRSIHIKLTNEEFRNALLVKTMNEAETWKDLFIDYIYYDLEEYRERKLLE